MSTYVSPFDPTTAEPVAFAPRPTSLEGRRVVLFDISKNRGAAFLDRIEHHLRAEGATTHRLVKPTFSRRAPGELIASVPIHGDLVVQGLAD